MKRWMHIFIPGVLLATVMACSHRRLLEENGAREPDRSWNWGGTPGRSGYHAGTTRFPMDLAWIHKAQAGVERALNAFNGYVLFGTKDGTVVILDADRGKPVRRVRFRKKSGVTCVVDGPRLITAQRWGEDVLASTRLNTLERVWHVPSGFVEGEPLLVDGRVVVASVSGELLCLDAETGSRAWGRDLGASVRGSPCSATGAVFLTTEEGSIWSLDTEDGGVRWRHRVSGTFIAGPVAAQGALFVGSKEERFYAFDASTGEPLWSKRTRGRVFEEAAFAGGSVFYGTALGDIVCLEADTGEERWRFETGAGIGASPLVTENAVVFGNLDGLLYALDRFTGEALWRFKARGRVRTTPLIWDGMLFCASEDEYVYGFKPAD